MRRGGRRGDAIALVGAIGALALALPGLAAGGDAPAAPEAGAGSGLASDRADRTSPKSSGPPLATCFWEGPISMRQPSTRGFDGRYFNFPEESATYWMSRFALPSGSKLFLRGRYPHARYISLNSYSEAAPTDTLSDIAIEPDPGSTNPFEPGARRDLRKRRWHVEVLDAEPPSDPAARAPNTLYARPEGATALITPIEVFYRVYEPDRGLGLTGGKRLPRAELVLADGTVLEGEEACAEINDANREITVDTTPEYQWETARGTPPCDGDTNPAYDPPRWERFFTYEFAALSVIADCTAAGRDGRRADTPPVEGGNYSNRDSAYIYAHLAQEFGEVFVLSAKLPRTPITRDGRKRMREKDMRFWSLCTGESRVTTFTPDCLADRQVPIDGERRFTIAVSKRAARPANARRRCGFGWLDWGDRGDGVGDPGYGFLILRNMLASPRFEHAIQRVETAGSEPEVMGEYFPRSEYSSLAEFEARGCPKPAR